MILILNMIYSDQATTRQMQSNHQLKKNINRKIKECSGIVNGIKRCLRPDHPIFDTAMKIVKYEENEVRFHRTTLMLVEAAEQDKPKTLVESLIKKRVEYMSIALELLPALVEAGVIEEQVYLGRCKEHKVDYDALHTGLVAYDE